MSVSLRFMYAANALFAMESREVKLKFRHLTEAIQTKQCGLIWKWFFQP